MDIAIIGSDVQLATVAGWLGDEGHLVRSFSSVAELVSRQLDRPLQVVLLACLPVAEEQAQLEAWSNSCDWPEVRRFLIDGEPVDGWMILSQPLRRRVVLATLQGA